MMATAADATAGLGLAVPFSFHRANPVSNMHVASARTTLVSDGLVHAFA